MEKAYWKCPGTASPKDALFFISAFINAFSLLLNLGVLVFLLLLKGKPLTFLIQHCQQTFRARIELVEHLRTQCTSYPTTLTFASAPVPAPTASAPTTAPTLTTVAPNPRALPPPTITTSMISAETAAATTTTTTSTTSPIDRNAVDTTSIFTLTSNDADSFQTCPHCDRKFISHFGCVSHLRIHRQRLANQCL
nr:unnamed protein product [Spirometra erinaceieuropaei]